MTVDYLVADDAARSNSEANYRVQFRRKLNSLTLGRYILPVTRSPRMSTAVNEYCFRRKQATSPVHRRREMRAAAQMTNAARTVACVERCSQPCGLHLIADDDR